MKIADEILKAQENVDRLYKVSQGWARDHATDSKKAEAVDQIHCVSMALRSANNALLRAHDYAASVAQD